MRKIPFLLIFLLSIDVWVLADADPTPLPIGEKASDFSLPGTDGKTWSLNDFSSSGYWSSFLPAIIVLPRRHTRSASKAWSPTTKAAAWGW